MLIPILLFALAPVQPQPMFADYVLNVPLRIENMPAITSALVSCNIAHFGSTTIDRQLLGTPGTGIVSVPVVGGNFNGTVTVTVNVSATNALRYPPNTWMCSFNYNFRAPDGSEFRESVSSTERAAAYTRITGQAIDTNTTDISGPLPGG